jgi:hypothetical protein
MREGIVHLNIGADRGILKNASWSKTNVPYLREARMFREKSLGDLAQLSNYYNVSTKLFGNFIFYPGMKVFINPFGLGGTKLGDPCQKFEDGTINFARLMGIGGYHLVTGVSTSIGVDGFETDMECRFVYSGDADGNGNGIDLEQPTKTPSTSVTQPGAQTQQQATECRGAIAVAQAQYVGIPGVEDLGGEGDEL